MMTLFIQPSTPRPDFRLVITFLWDDLHNVDTEGDAQNPASKEWTELYCKDRECEQQAFAVEAVSDEPLTLRIRSEMSEMAARVAFFLATETRSLVAESDAGPWHSPEWLIDQVGGFDLAEAKERVVRSRWQKATPDNPYPQPLKAR
jgi:hypothetical protein